MVINDSEKPKMVNGLYINIYKNVLRIRRKFLVKATIQYNDSDLTIKKIYGYIYIIY